MVDVNCGYLPQEGQLSPSVPVSVDRPLRNIYIFMHPKFREVTILQAKKLGI